MSKKLAAGLATAALGLIAVLATPAEAHVTVVSSGNLVKGTSARWSFSVPNESATRSDTVRVAVQFPTDHPVASVAVAVKPGWTVRITKRKLTQAITVRGAQVSEVVDTVTWSGGKIPAEMFDDFLVKGLLPSEASVLDFKVVQTYADGKVVRWTEPRVEGQPEPEHPVARLTLTDPVPATTAPAGSPTPTTTAK